MAATMQSGLAMFEELKRLEQVYKADASDITVSFGSPGGALGTYHLRGVSSSSVSVIREYVTKLANRLDIENLSVIVAPVQFTEIKDTLRKPEANE